MNWHKLQLKEKLHVPWIQEKKNGGNICSTKAKKNKILRRVL
jgi:hypothetical protein